MITSVNHLTSSISSAHYASKENKSRGLGLVVLAKGNEGTSVVIEATYANRRERSFRYGYTRFGLRPVWVGHYTLPVSSAERRSCPNGQTVNQLICSNLVREVVAAANATELARKNAA